MNSINDLQSLLPTVSERAHLHHAQLIYGSQTRLIEHYVQYLLTMIHLEANEENQDIYQQIQNQT